jgi:hypothetical protein
MGSWNYFAPILPKLTEEYDLRILADPEGMALGMVQKSGYAFEIADATDLDPTDVSLVLSGTGDKATRLWRNATIAAQAGNVPCAWFGDFYASGCEACMRDLTPDFAAFFDPLTRDRFVDGRPEFRDRRNAVTLGNPSFDPIASFDVASARVRTRATLGLKETHGFVLCVASSFKQVDFEGESLAVLLPWLRNNDDFFACRFHPADKAAAPERVERISRVLKAALGERLIDTSALNGLELAAGADLVVTDYSTEGVKSCLAGIPTAFLMLESARKYQREQKGGTLPFFSILKEQPYGVSPAIGVWAPDEGDKLNWAWKPSWVAKMKQALEQNSVRILADGKAGHRVLKFISDIVA